MESLNREVLEYLEAERVAPNETTTAWVIDGYSLATHPDLCDRLDEVNAAAAEPATSGYRYGKPVLIAENGVIVAFAGGTYVLCLRLHRNEVDPRLVGGRREKVSKHPLLRRKQEQLDALVAGEWTWIEPWPVDVPKDEGLPLLAATLQRAVEQAMHGNSSRQTDGVKARPFDRPVVVRRGLRNLVIVLAVWKGRIDSIGYLGPHTVYYDGLC